MYTQIITPTPNIPCQAGWCLQYVRQAFDLPIRYGSATEAWENSPTQHPDGNFPEGVWHPVWYGLEKDPMGHVVLPAPNGNVYSTSDYSGRPRIHRDLADLEAFYAYYGMELQYRGWTEDVCGFPVIANAEISAQGTTLEDDFMALFANREDFDIAVTAILERVVEPMHQTTRKATATNVLKEPVPYFDPNTGKDTGRTTSLATLAGFADFQANQTRLNTDAKSVAANIPDSIAAEVLKLLSERLAK